MIRTIIFWALMVPHTIVITLLAILTSLFDNTGKVTQKLCRAWSWVLLKMAGTTVDVEGGENVDLTKPRIYISNHQSYFDVFALMNRLPGNARFVAKKSLERIPFFGRGMRAVGTVILDREHPEKAREELTKGCGENLGRSMGAIIFPEGSRSHDGKLLEFKMGAFILAIQTGIPLIPIAVKGSGDVMNAQGLRISPGKISIRIGDPIDTAGLTVDDRHSLADKTKKQVQRLLDGDIVTVDKAA